MKYRILLNGKPLQSTGGIIYEFESYVKALDTVIWCYGEESLKKFVKIEPVINQN